ncbi:hypothetical protein B0H17DRAFT_711669 [Mycena rosella]|uniref:Uncharacterized protein n=1 Tax=Mycena rosella TaxID=1033263 RepID=A0AAD7GG43_MYCRO|nr:hypothetical protein B0H17DRAFT_711669 [Mycena rosella]
MSPPFFHHASPNLPVPRATFPKPTAIPKAPIVNPYEKFTQPQFDAWIGDITGALRGALGYRAEPPPKPKARAQWHIPAPRSSEAPDATDEDAEVDDSFAEVKARRAIAENGKGKGRDPREGPGLGRGDRGAPIEIDLDSEEEEEQEEQEQEEWDEEEEGMQTSDEEEEEENALRNGESSAHAHARYRRYADRREDEAEDEYEDEDGDAHDPEVVEVISDDEEGGERDVNGLPLQDGDGSGDEYSDEEHTNPSSFLVVPPNPDRIPERDYSDEGEEETGSESEDEAVAGSSPPRVATQSHPPEPRYVLDDVFGEEDDELHGAAKLSSPLGQHGEPEIIELVSDEEEEEEEGLEDEEDLQEDEAFAPEDQQAERDEDLRRHPRLHIPTHEQEIEEDDGILPGSSPILSSPVEPEHSFPPNTTRFSTSTNSKMAQRTRRISRNPSIGITRPRSRVACRHQAPGILRLQWKMTTSLIATSTRRWRRSGRATSFLRSKASVRRRQNRRVNPFSMTKTPKGTNQNFNHRTWPGNTSSRRLRKINKAPTILITSTRTPSHAAAPSILSISLWKNHL